METPDMLMVRHPNRPCEGRALVAQLLAALNLLHPDTTLGQITAALADAKRRTPRMPVPRGEDAARRQRVVPITAARRRRGGA
jgi:hypothetical protein